jgi:hypothetical protein
VILAMNLASLNFFYKTHTLFGGDFCESACQIKYSQYFGIACSHPWIAAASERLMPKWRFKKF